MKNLKISLFTFFTLLFAFSFSRLAHSQTPITGEKIGIGTLDLRWNMSIEAAKTATPQQHRFESAGRYRERDYFQISEIPVAGFLDNPPEIFLAMLIFQNDRLVAFEMRPKREEGSARLIGTEYATTKFLGMNGLNNQVFGNAALKAPLQSVNRAKARFNGVETTADLGFQVQFRVWSARGAFYRESLLRGNQADNLLVTRFQGRLSAPFQTPTEKIVENSFTEAGRTAFALDVSDNFGLPPSLQKPMLADETLFLPAKPPHQGNGIGIGRFNWNMTGEEILATRLPDGAKIRAVGKTAFQIENWPLETGSNNRWVLQLWLDKRGLSEFEVRPMHEIHSAQLVGLANDSFHQKELNAHIERVFRIENDQWWATNDEALTRVKRKYGVTTWFTTPARTQNYAVLGSDGNYQYGSSYVPESSYPSTRIYKEFLSWPVALDFSIRDRAWNTGETRYRQGQIFGAKKGPKMGVVRWQGRRDGKPFLPVTGEVVKTKNKSIVLREIYENYNVIPGANR